MQKLCLLILFFVIFSSCMFSKPKMIEIKDEKNNLSIEISETLITMKEYKEYLSERNPNKLEDFEQKKIRFTNYIPVEFENNWPVWGITWRDAADYCNWLSEKEGYMPCYYLVETEENPKYGKIIMKEDANGYRLPYIRELLILSGIKEGLTQEKFEKENTSGLKLDPDKNYPLPVSEGKKNSYGIYDILGNLSQFCNDYYQEGYNYFDYTLSPYGPETYTPDEDQLYYNEPLTAVRCYFGGGRSTTYKELYSYLIIYANELSEEFTGIRVVRQINHF